MFVIEKCVMDIIIRNWVLYSECTYPELGFEFQMYIFRIVNCVSDVGMRKYIFLLMNLYIQKLR